MGIPHNSRNRSLIIVAHALHEPCHMSKLPSELIAELDTLKDRKVQLVTEPTVATLVLPSIQRSGLEAIVGWLKDADPECLDDSCARYELDPKELNPRSLNKRRLMQLLLPGLREDEDNPDNPVADCQVEDAEHIPEIAGRLCYRSFGDKAGRRSNYEYMSHIFGSEPRHMSVAYHPKMTFFFAGVSRKFSHQFIRNYVGSDRSEEGSPSQESTRFCLHSGRYVVPPAYLNGLMGSKEDLAGFRDLCQQNYWDYIDEYTRACARHVQANQSMPRGMEKKRILEACAGTLSSHAETAYVWTTNPAAIRKFLLERAHEAADAEMRRFCWYFGKEALRHPNLFLGPDMEPIRAFLQMPSAP